MERTLPCFDPIYHILNNLQLYLKSKSNFCNKFWWVQQAWPTWSWNQTQSETHLLILCSNADFESQCIAMDRFEIWRWFSVLMPILSSNDSRSSHAQQDVSPSLFVWHHFIALLPMYRAKALHCIASLKVTCPQSRALHKVQSIWSSSLPQTYKVLELNDMRLQWVWQYCDLGFKASREVREAITSQNRCFLYIV